MQDGQNGRKKPTLRGWAFGFMTLVLAAEVSPLAEGEGGLTRGGDYICLVKGDEVKSRGYIFFHCVFSFLPLLTQCCFVLCGDSGFVEEDRCFCKVGVRGIS